MSGIAAVYDRAGGPGPERLVSAMIDTMRHRGPDGASVDATGPAALGNCLLKTVPEDELDSQPVRSSRRDCSIVADARIDNRDDIAAAIAKVETRPTAQMSDAALILGAYERWGTECASKLLGDFAFVIWDGEQQRLYCARDQIGVRFLFYHADRGAFRCATEMKALFADRTVERKPHWRSMASYVCWEYTENDQTLYENVFALPGAHWLVATASSVETKRYWRPDPWRRWAGASDDEYAEGFADVFGRAVRSRMRSDRRLAVHVSGGLDSSSVAAEAVRQHRNGSGPPEEPLLVRLTFPGLPCDESAYSQSVADHLQVPLASVSAVAELDAVRPDLSPEHPDLYYMPTGDFFRPTLEIARERGARTTLTGQGGDFMLRSTAADCSADLVAGRLGRVARCTGLVEHPLALASWQALLATVRPLVPLWARELTRPVRPVPPPPNPCLAAAAWKAVREHHYELQRLRAADAYPDPVMRQFCEELDGYDPKYCLARWDRLAGSLGAEYRHPFHDLRVVELLLSMPLEQRSVPGLIKPKPVLRRAMHQGLPERVRTRKDAALFLSFEELALESHRSRVEALLNDSRLTEAGILDPQVVRRMLELRGTEGQPTLFYLVNVVALELWLRQMT